MDISAEVLPTPKTHRNDMLKLIALLTMLIDHIACLFFPEQVILRTIGRIAFPIFAYQISIGFKKTSSRKRYAFRLFLFACLSQIPYSWFNLELYFYWKSFNIMFTFLIALGVLQTLEMCKTAFSDYMKTREPVNIIKGLAFGILSIAVLVAPEISRFKYHFSTEYGMIGILFVLLFYFLGKQFIPLAIGYIILSAFGVYYGAAIHFYNSSGKSFFDCLFAYKSIWYYNSNYADYLRSLRGVFFQSRSIMALPIIWGLNYIDQLNRFNFKLNKYVAYFFYPVHMGILITINFFVR
jgi:hypothetical protein